MVQVKQKMQAPGGVGDGQARLIQELATAAFVGNMQKVRQMVEQHPWLLHARDARGDTVLVKACMNGSCETATYLLDKGADINQPEEVSRLLSKAVLGNHMAVFNLLLERGANPLVVDPNGYNILAAACVLGNVDAVTAVLKVGQVRDAINTQTMSGTTALAIATFYGHTKIVRLLL